MTDYLMIPGEEFPSLYVTHFNVNVAIPFHVAVDCAVLPSGKAGQQPPPTPRTLCRLYLSPSALKGLVEVLSQAVAGWEGQMGPIESPKPGWIPPMQR